MIKSLMTSISLLSMGLGFSYWEGICNIFKLRGGGNVLTKSDKTSKVAIDSFSLQVIANDDATTEPSHVDDSDRLNEYNRSPYERHFPNYLLDPWMRKQVNSIPSKENEVCLVHVGKVRLSLYFYYLITDVSIMYLQY